MIGLNNLTLGKQKFSNDSNMIYKFESAEKLLADEDKLVEMIQHHQKIQRPRLRTLREYYKGNNESILSEASGLRRREEHLADNRATHNFAKYVSQFIQGYMMGVPLKTSYPDESIDEQLRDINRNNEADEHNSELVLDQSIYGRAFEMVYRHQSDETRFITLDVLETFIVHDETIESNPIAAIRYIGKQFEDDTLVHIYTKEAEHIFELNMNNKLKYKDETTHYFGELPIVEYANNKYRQGDFEDVIGLIDLYDNAQSDTANYMEDINDAMLLIKGNLDIDVDEARAMKQANVLMLQEEVGIDGKTGSGADAKYIYKQYDVAGTEAYKNRIFQNILLFTSIPNLLDDTGSGQQSGEMIKMKLFALSQKRATKERLFKRALRERYRLINNIGKIAKENNFDVNEISITFTENLPSMVDKELKWFTDAGGQLSNATLLEQLSFIENADEEIEKIEEEDKLNNDSYTFGEQVADPNDEE